MKKCLVLFLAAGCLATTALGQEVLPESARGPIYNIDHNGKILGQMSPYEARAVDFTYRNNGFDPGAPLVNLAAGWVHSIEDVQFTGTAWASTLAHSFSRVQFSLYHPVSTPSGTALVQYRIWDMADVNFNGFTGPGTTIFRAGAAPLFTLNVTLPSVTAASVYGFNAVDFAPATLTESTTGTVHNGFAVEMSLLSSTTGGTHGTYLANDAWRFILTNGGNAPAPAIPPTIGATTNPFGVDSFPATGITPLVAPDDIFIGGTPGNGTDFRTLQIGGPTRLVAPDFAMGGDLGACPAPSATAFTLGASNAVATQTSTLAANGVKWYSIVLASDVTDAASKYIDLDTEGSAIDTSIALFKSDGTLVASDTDSGSGVNAQLSFGIGRRSAVGDGLQYDGRNFDGTGALAVHGLSAGTYYVAVAGIPVSFGPCFAAASTGTGGSATLHVRTNVADGVLNPSVAPISTRITGPGGEDPLVAPGGQSAAVAFDGPGIIWEDFQTCVNADSNNTVSITGNSGANAPLNYSITLFDSNGNEVGTATGNDTAPATLSFGGGGNPLPAGHYYLASTYATPDLAPNPTTAGRWHARGENASGGYNFQTSVLVSNATCGAVCGSADFNGDGDVGTDQDIEAFFSCLAGNCCATCGTADFNGDGDVGTDQDIEAFFRVLAGGTC